MVAHHYSPVFRVPMTAAIFYSLVKKPTNGKIFGIQVAILDWVSAFFRYSNQEQIPFLVRSRESIDEVERVAEEIGVDKKRILPWDARFPRENLRDIDTVFRVDPMPGDLMWQRTLLDGNGFSFCGLAHAIAGLEGGDILERYCLGPSEVGDAIVCPSRAIKSAIQSFWDSYSDYLATRFKASFTCPVQLPIIPLGVDIERIEKLCTSDKRAHQRAQLGLGPDDVAVLWVGRLSHAIKAHPLAMFRAVSEAAKMTTKKLHFVLVGYFEPETYEDEWRRMAKEFCPNVPITFTTSANPDFPDGLWAGSDIFLSLIDNMQESFGLTPIEAIAAGLPRVISDWDGYRDSVDHGKDGFLVRTIQPRAGFGRDLAEHLLADREMYYGFLAKTALSVSVDYRHAAECIAVLAENPDLRRRMQETAKQRLPNYAWKNIIPAYEAVWKDLHAARVAHVKKTPKTYWPSVPPQMPDPFSMYQSFPTRTLQDNDRLALSSTPEEVRLLCSYEMNTHALDLMIPPLQIPALVNWMGERNDASVQEISAAFEPLSAAQINRTLVWMVKLGILRLI